MGDETTELSLLQSIFRKAATTSRTQNRRYNPSKSDQQLLNRYQQIEDQYGPLLDQQMSGETLTNEQLKLLEKYGKQIIDYRTAKPKP